MPKVERKNLLKFSREIESVNESMFVFVIRQFDEIF